jgi:hypothetical protein
MALAGVVGAAALLRVAPAMVRSVGSSRRIAAPGESRVHLAAGRHLIFERTGTKSGGGGFTLTRSHGITLSQDQVSVTTASGAPLKVDVPTGAVETITLDSRIYTGAIGFRTPADGDYIIRIDTDEERELLVAHSIGDTFASVAGWFAVGLAAAFIGLLGVVLLIVGEVRRNRAGRS